jgi:hypothetical protein
MLDNLAGLLKQRVRELGIPFKEAVNRTIRAVRITTNRRVVARSLPVQHVMARLHTWLALPHVHVVQPSITHSVGPRAELERLGTAGNLTRMPTWPSSQWSRHILSSTDTDFVPFFRLRWVNHASICGRCSSRSALLATRKSAGAGAAVTTAGSVTHMTLNRREETRIVRAGNNQGGDHA